MEALKILRKHMEGHYLFGNEVSSKQAADFRKSLVSAMEEYAELRLSNVEGQSEQSNIKRWCLQCKCREAQRDGLCKQCYDEIEL